MQKLHFVCKQQPDCYPFPGESYLYNHADYLALKAARFGTPLTFYALRGEVAVARIHFFLQSGPDGKTKAVSLPESPFGSLEFGDVTYDELRGFMSYIMKKLKMEGIIDVLIKDCVMAYRSQQHIMLSSLFKDTGFRQEERLSNHHVIVNSTPLISKIHHMERRRVRKCFKAGFAFEKTPLANLDEQYNFILKCRNEKKRKLSLSLQDLQAMVSFLPSSYLIFSSYDSGQLIATAICVRVNASALYVFYPASSLPYNNYSPTAYLLANIYDYCQKNGYSLLDLGTSNSESVARFKKNMGGLHSYKYTYQLKLR